MNGAYQAFVTSGQLGYNSLPWLGPLIFIAVIWTLVWKAIAMWKAAGRGSKVWFVILLVVNTLGILDIIYIYAVGKKPKI